VLYLDESTINVNILSLFSLFKLCTLLRKLKTNSDTVCGLLLETDKRKMRVSELLLPPLQNFNNSASFEVEEAVLLGMRIPTFRDYVIPSSLKFGPINPRR
jgi:hypothetical protein